MRDFVLIAVIAIVSFGLRASFTAFAGHRALPVPVENLLANLKPAAFAGLTVTALTAHGGVGAAHVLGVVVAGWTARRGNLASALVAGMAVYFIAGQLS